MAALSTTTRRPSTRAAVCRSASCVPASGSLGLTSSATIRAGNEFVQQRQPLRRRVGIEPADPGHVPARPIETGDEAGLDRVAADVEDDRDRRGCRLGGEGRTETAGRRDHGHLALNQVGRQCRQSIALPFRPTIFDRDIAALDIAGLLQPLAKGGQVRHERSAATGR